MSAIGNKHVAELIRLAPDAIVANTTAVVAALRLATSTIPIIFALLQIIFFVHSSSRPDLDRR